jgi:salicylate 5-hydroxylase small subunit
VVGAPRVLAVDDDGIRSEASYVVIRTKRDAMAEILSAGRYLDRIVRVDGSLLFAERHVIFDNDLIPNSIIDPL